MRGDRTRVVYLKEQVLMMLTLLTQVTGDCETYRRGTAKWRGTLYKKLYLEDQLLIMLMTLMTTLGNLTETV